MVIAHNMIVRYGHLLCFVLLTLVLNGQSNRLSFDHISIKEGLSQATVNDVIKDHQGLIWITTNEGLNRYDGYNFKIYRTSDDSTSISSNYTERLYRDKNDNIWISTANGINRYNRDQDNFERYYGTNRDEDTENFSVNEIIEDGNGALWFSTRNSNHYLYRYDEKAERFVEHLHPTIREPMNRIVALDSTNLLVSFSSKNLFLFNTITYTYQKLPQTLPEEALRMIKDANNTVWIGTDNGGLHAFTGLENELRSFNHDPENNESISSNVIWDLDLSSDGSLWLATDKGLNIFDTESETFTSYQYNNTDPSSISSNFLLCVYEEDNGRLWAGTSESGLNVLHPSHKAFEHYNNQMILGQSLSNNAVWSIEESYDGSIWVGTSEGLNRFDKEDHTIERYFNDPENPSSISHNRVWAIKQDPHENSIWLGTSNGLNKMTQSSSGDYRFESWQHDPNNDKTLSANSIRCLLVEEDGIWAGTNDDGVNYFDKKTKKVIRYRHDDLDYNSISSDRIRQIYRDSKGILWVATQKGLNVLKDNKFHHFLNNKGNDNTLSNNHIRVIKESVDHVYWIGTDYGLNRLIYDDVTEEYSFKLYTTADGLPNNRVYAIEFEEDHLWISTNNGVSKFDPNLERFINFYDVDGIQSNEFNQGASHQDEAGYLYFGGINGMSRFLPKNIEAQDVKQQIIFTNFKVHFNDVSISPDGPLSSNIITAPDISLDYDERMFSIEFNALNFNKQVKNRYAYRLKPYEEKWNFVDQLNQAVYNNVPPGHYTFEVKTSTYGESHPDEINHINIHLKRAYWETWWFRILSALSFLGLIYLTYQYRLRSLINAQHELEEKVKERTHVIESQKKTLQKAINRLKSTQSQLVEQEKMATIGQLTAGIAHEINNPINYISNNTDALVMDMQDMQGVIKSILLLKEEDGKEMIKEIIDLRDEVDFAYLNEEINELVKGIKEGTQRTSDIIKSLRYLSYKDKPEKELLNIHDPINSAIAILSSKLKGRITLNKHFAQLPRILGYPGELNQVFVNIISNSVQAIDDTGIIDISTSLLDDDHVQVTLKDNGHGMKDEVKKRIFEPFYTTKDVGQGTGLGLSISYGVVESHGGKIEVDSNLGDGTEIRIVLPIR